MYQTISENSDFSVYQTIFNKRQDTALFEQCPKLSSQHKNAKMFHGSIYDFQTLNATSEQSLDSLKDESEDFNSFYERTYNDQLQKASIKYHRLLNYNHYLQNEALVNSNENIQELNNFKCPENVYQHPNFDKKSESESTICCSTDDTEVPNNKNCVILMNECTPPTEKGILNSTQTVDCPKTNENLDSISQNLDNTRYTERLTAHEFLTDEKYVCQIPTENKRTIPSVLQNYSYIKDVSSKQPERTNMVNISLDKSASTYEHPNCYEKHFSDHLSKIANQKRIICSRQPKRSTDYPETHYRYTGINEVLEKQVQSTRSLLENTDQENKEYFTNEVSNQNRMASLRQVNFQNYPINEYQHLSVVDGQTIVEDMDKQINEETYVKVPPCETSWSYQVESLSMYPERKEHWTGFDQSYLLDPQNLTESQVCSTEISEMPTSKTKEDFRKKHQENTIFSRGYPTSLDKESTPQKEPDFPVHLHIKENLCINDYNSQEGKCSDQVKGKKEPSLKCHFYPKSRYEIMVYKCFNPSCKSKESMLCIILKPEFQTNYEEHNYQEHTAPDPSSKNVIGSNPKIRGEFQNSYKKDYSLKSNNWQGTSQNQTEKLIHRQSDQIECKPKPGVFSIRNPNDFLTVEEVAKIVRNLRIQSENSTEPQLNQDNLNKFDNGNASKFMGLYESIDAEPECKVLSNSCLHKNIQSGTSKSVEKNHNIFKMFFNKSNKVNH